MPRRTAARASRRWCRRWSRRSTRSSRCAGPRASTPTSSRTASCYVARSAAQLERMHEGLTSDRAWGIGEHHQRELTAAELRDRMRVEGALGATFSPHARACSRPSSCAGIAAAVERRGVRDPRADTAVTGIEPGVGDDRARVSYGRGRVLRCLEGYTAGIRGQRRTWLPMNSAMIVTEPLPEPVWDAIGWRRRRAAGRQRERLLLCPADRRRPHRPRRPRHPLPLRLAHRRRRPDAGLDHRVAHRRSCTAMFPATRDVPHRRTHGAACSGSRATGARASRSTRRPGSAGPAATSAAGSPRPTSPAAPSPTSCWAGTPSSYACRGSTGGVRRWEPEPLRWLGVRAMYGLYREADRRENKGLARPSRLARIGDRLTGR